MSATGSSSEHWTPERIARLKQLVEDGATFEVAGADLGISRNAAIGKATRMEFKPAPGARLNVRQAAQAVAHQKRQVTKISAPSADFPAPGGCVWPHGDPGEDGFHFCAADIAGPGLPYCPKHMATAYVGIAKRGSVTLIDRSAGWPRAGKEAA